MGRESGPQGPFKIGLYQQVRYHMHCSLIHSHQPGRPCLDSTGAYGNSWALISDEKHHCAQNKPGTQAANFILWMKLVSRGKPAQDFCACLSYWLPKLCHFTEPHLLYVTSAFLVLGLQHVPHLGGVIWKNWTKYINTYCICSIFHCRNTGFTAA